MAGPRHTRSRQCAKVTTDAAVACGCCSVAVWPPAVPSTKAPITEERVDIEVGQAPAPGSTVEVVGYQGAHLSSQLGARLLEGATRRLQRALRVFGT